MCFSRKHGRQVFEVVGLIVGFQNVQFSIGPLFPDSGHHLGLASFQYLFHFCVHGLRSSPLLCRLLVFCDWLCEFQFLGHAVYLVPCFSGQMVCNNLGDGDFLIISFEYDDFAGQPFLAFWWHDDSGHVFDGMAASVWQIVVMDGFDGHAGVASP